MLLRNARFATLLLGQVAPPLQFLDFGVPTPRLLDPLDARCRLKTWRTLFEIRLYRFDLISRTD